MTPSPITRILIHGHYNQRNIGDEALLESLIRSLAAYSERTPLEVAYVADVDVDMRAIPGIVYRRLPSDFSTTLRYARASDLVIFGGGSQFQDFGSLARTRYLLKPLLLAFAAPRVGGVGLSLGPVQTLVGRLLTRLTLKRMLSVHVRDEASVHLARTLGVSAISGKDLLLTQSLITESRPHPTGQHLMVSLLPFVATSRLTSEQQEQALSHLKGALMAIQERRPELNVRGVAFENASDTPVLLAALPQADVPLHGSVHDMTRGLSQANFVLATRLHSLIFSFLLRKPTLIITYHPKVEALAAQLGYSERTQLSPEDLLDPTIVAERLNELIDHPQGFMPSAEPDVIGEQARFSLNHALTPLLEGVSRDADHR